MRIFPSFMSDLKSTISLVNFRERPKNSRKNDIFFPLRLDQ